MGFDVYFKSYVQYSHERDDVKVGSRISESTLKNVKDEIRKKIESIGISIDSLSESHWLGMNLESSDELIPLAASLEIIAPYSYCYILPIEFRYAEQNEDILDSYANFNAKKRYMGRFPEISEYPVWMIDNSNGDIRMIHKISLCEINNHKLDEILSYYEDIHSKISKCKLEILNGKLYGLHN